MVHHYVGKYVVKSVFLHVNMRLVVACRHSFHMPLQAAKHFRVDNQLLHYNNIIIIGRWEFVHINPV